MCRSDKKKANNLEWSWEEKSNPIKSRWQPQTQLNWITEIKNTGRSLSTMPLAVSLKSNCAVSPLSFVPNLLTSRLLFFPFSFAQVWAGNICAFQVELWCPPKQHNLATSNNLHTLSHTFAHTLAPVHTHTTCSLVAGQSIAVVMDAACWCTRCPLTCNWMCRVHTLYHDRAIPSTGHRLLNGW